MADLNALVAALRPYQKVGVRWLAETGRRVLADDPGAGKSIQALAAVRLLTDDPVLIVSAPRPSYGVWTGEIARWLGEPSHVFAGSAKEREAAWAAFVDRGGWLITNYQHLGTILALKRRWAAVVIDEAHNLRNRDGAWFKGRVPKVGPPVLGAKQIRADVIFPMTGTPVVNHATDLWPLLHLVDPQAFRGFWPWVDTFFRTAPSPYARSKFAKEILGVRDAAGLRSCLAPYLLRRKKEDILPELPAKIRQAVPITLTPAQRKLYDAISRDMLAEVDGGLLLTPTVLAQMTRLRQICVTPALVGGPDDSAHLDALGELVAAEIEQHRPVGIFTAFAAAIPYIEKRIAPYVEHITIIQGGQRTDPSARIQAFQQLADHRKAFIATVQSSASWTAHGAKTAFFVGPDWTPATNTQAEDRLHRFGQKDTVRALYLLAGETVEAHMLDLLDRKVTWEALALDPRALIRGTQTARFIGQKVELEEYIA